MKQGRSEVLGVGAARSGAEWDKVYIGIDPGTSVMGYGILGIKGRNPSMIAMGVIKLSRFDSHYLRLRHIHERVSALVGQYLPDEMAIEAPFFGKNVQSMLKLGRAQGVAMSAALERDIPIAEYEPRKIKMAITGNGAASKEQVQQMLRRILSIPADMIMPELDATDALGAALCHHYEQSRPQVAAGPRSWKEFIAKNPGRVK
ncbi:MAG TPA: crossover junction endodeoxyribonuclease RuvC [Porphyromonadaceae bacterium]|jgi:crossover junction endodeoxyribonuclease RuvC|nr:crossover junction endodeoxyribonuclease RuvC [Muribaculaceae bacterium Isolate-013 (NCI)]HAP29442.1 crossover junction endodeoxyribonuclease RuvC [Porphyromonadaceae bacterium]